MAPTELNPGIEKLQDHARGIFQAAVEEADPALALERALGGGSDVPLPREGGPVSYTHLTLPPKA